MKKAQVAVLMTRPETVLSDYRRLLDLARVERHLAPDATTILKDNISWHLFFPSSNTTPWQLEGTILGLRDKGFDDLVDVHNKTVVTIADKGERYNKYAPVLHHYGIPVRYNFKPEHMSWPVYAPRGRMLVLDRIFPEGITVPDYFHGKNIVHLPTVKTHSYTTTTGAMKNAFGGLLNIRRHYTHSWIHDTLVDLLTIQKEIHAGVFAVMDGTTAGEGPGPRTMIPHVKNVLLASADQVAIDAVAAKMMGFDPMGIRYIARATELGLGTGRPEEIEILGEEDALSWNWRFTVGVNFATGTGRLLWHSPLRFMQRLLFHTPIVNMFIFASEVYHDRFWYPVRGRPVVDRWLEETEWGRLWRRYPDEPGAELPGARERPEPDAATRSR
jgi:hypothetical protein